MTKHRLPIKKMRKQMRKHLAAHEAERRKEEALLMRWRFSWYEKHALSRFVTVSAS